MRTTLVALAAGTVLASALAALPALADPAPEGRAAIGLVGDDKLVRLDLAEGGKSRGGPRVTGLVADTGLVGIDFRPQDGLLYGVGDLGGLYRLDVSNGVATPVGRLTVPLRGTSFGVDFNPAANALRVVSDDAQNLRQPFATVVNGIDGDQAPTAVDADLNYGGTATTPTTTAGGTKAIDVTGAAYTLNDGDGAPAPADQPPNGNTGTTLYDIDADRDQLVLQAPPNNGILTSVGVEPEAGDTRLGVDTSDVVGFDISSTVVGGKAVSGADRAFAVLTTVDGARLYEIGLSSGRAALIGDLDKAVTDLAVRNA